MCCISHYAQKAALFLFIAVYVYDCIHQSDKICVLMVSFQQISSLAILEMILHSEVNCPLAASISTF